MAEKPDYYAVLGVVKTATREEIEKAYKAFAFKNHPDRLRAAGKTDDEIKQAEQKLSIATEAKTVLLDPAKRRTYDSYGHDGLERMANGSSAGTGQSYSDAAGKPRIKTPLSEGDLFDFFDKRKEHGEREQQKTGDGLSPAERRARAADQRRADREARMRGSPPPPSSATTPPASSDDEPRTTRDEFKDTAQKVGEAAERLRDSGMAAVPVDALVKFRENLQDFMDQIDAAISQARPPKNGTRRP